MVWPPGSQSLDDAFDKLRWAKEHFETLRREIEPFAERDTHTIRCEVDPDTGQYSFSVHNLERPDSDDWGLRVGDCLHNARTALDYLMVRLFSLVTGNSPRFVERVEFPISDDPDKFNPKSGSCARAVIEMRKHPAFSGYLARIEELQPFNRGNQSIWGTVSVDEGMARPLFPIPVLHALPTALKRLSRLDNLDKHRVIHAAWLAIKAADGVPTDFIPPDFDFKGSYTYQGPLENDTEIGSMQFTTPLPYEWQPSEVDMKRHFPLVVSIYDELRFAGSVLEVLPFCLWGSRPC
jgi:hypothetical protein